MQLKHNIGLSVELSNAAGELVLWKYVYGGKPKPFFHPLTTPGGQCLSLFEPHDHFWHRGLWFTIKFINGENFWEERPEEGFGRQATLVPPTISHNAAGKIELLSALTWQRPNNAGEVFRERRQIIYSPLTATAYALDFETELTAQADLLLDRTPYNGSWGGYGGLTLRGNRNWQQTRLLFSDGSTSERPLGLPARWCDLSGQFDGGQNLTGGLAIFDHPANLRHPSPWYGGTGSGHYFNAAFLFHQPLELAKDEVLRLKYRVLIHDDIWELTQLDQAYQAYLAE